MAEEGLNATPDQPQELRKRGRPVGSVKKTQPGCPRKRKLSTFDQRKGKKQGTPRPAVEVTPTQAQEGNRLDTQASPANKNNFWATVRSQKPGIVPKS